MPQLAEYLQFPLNSVGPKGEHAFLGIHRTFFQGSTGLVSTNYGVPGVTATRLSTGTYRYVLPKARAVYINPSIAGTSGTYYQANVVNNTSGISGICDVQISKGGVAQTPATGTVMDLWFFVAPVSQF